MNAWILLLLLKGAYIIILLKYTCGYIHISYILGLGMIMKTKQYSTITESFELNKEAGGKCLWVTDMY